MLPLDQQRCADALITPGNAALLIAVAVDQQLPVQFTEINSLRHRNPVVPAEVACFAFHSALLMPFARCAEIALEAPVRAERDEARGLFALIAAQDLLHCRLQVVITKLLKHSAEECKRQLVRL